MREVFVYTLPPAFPLYAAPYADRLRLAAVAAGRGRRFDGVGREAHAEARRARLRNVGVRVVAAELQHDRPARDRDRHSEAGSVVISGQSGAAEAVLRGSGEPRTWLPSSSSSSTWAPLCGSKRRGPGSCRHAGRRQSSARGQAWRWRRSAMRRRSRRRARVHPRRRRRCRAGRESAARRRSAHPPRACGCRRRAHPRCRRPAAAHAVSGITSALNGDPGKGLRRKLTCIV